MTPQPAEIPHVKNSLDMRSQCCPPNVCITIGATAKMPSQHYSHYPPERERLEQHISCCIIGHISRQVGNIRL